MKTTITKVSVIVPLFNDKQRIEKTILSLLKQNYPKDMIEIIVVDNGSTDGSPDIVAQYPVKLVFESAVRGPGAARNRGIERSVGEILAFIDSDCVAKPNWIEKGVGSMVSNNADLVAGDIHFVFSKKKSAAEYFDAISHMQNWLTVPTRGVAKTANLFVHRRVFKNIGLFNEMLLSGQDIFFTGLATLSGYKLIYADDAIIFHPTRNYFSIIKKTFRVAKGKRMIKKISTVKDFENSTASKTKTVWDLINPFNIKSKLNQKGYYIGFWKFSKILLISYTVIVINLIDIVIGNYIKFNDFG